jgi:hypothetical protein
LYGRLARAIRFFVIQYSQRLEFIPRRGLESTRPFHRLHPAHNAFRAAVISSGRNPVYAKQKLSPLRSRGRLFLCLLLLAFLAACPRSSRADSLEDAARALARQVAANHKKNLGPFYVWENRSSISQATSERMRKAFESETERLHSRLNLVRQADLSILITEGPSHILLIAEDLNQGHELIGSVTFPKGQFAAAERAGTVVTLDRQLLWQQPEMMLDLAQSSDPSGKPEVMLVLGKLTLSLYVRNQEKWVLKGTTLLPHSKPPLRDLRGEIHLEDHFFQFHLPGLECDGDAFQKLSFDCEDMAGIWRAEFDPGLPFSLDRGHNFFAVDPHYIGPERFSLPGFFSAVTDRRSGNDSQDQTTLAGADGHSYLYLSGNGRETIPESLERLPAEWGSDLVLLSAKCRESSLVVSSGARDHTSQDTLQGFEVEPRAATPATAVTEFPGPILSLKSTDDSGAVAIIFNLTTGNYEAYRVTMACGN